MTVRESGEEKPANGWIGSVTVGRIRRLAATKGPLC